MDFTLEIGSPVNKTVEKVYCKIRHKVEYNKYVVRSSTKSVVTYHKCGKKVHIKLVANTIGMVPMGNFPIDQQ